MAKRPIYEWVIEHDSSRPQKLYRDKNLNNDDDLVKRAVEGLITGRYKTYKGAAEDLAHESLQYVNQKRFKQTGKRWERIGEISSIVDRLQRKISKAWREHKNNGSIPTE